jgi:hypothetical protein
MYVCLDARKNWANQHTYIQTYIFPFRRFIFVVFIACLSKTMALAMEIERRNSDVSSMYFHFLALHGDKYMAFHVCFAASDQLTK